MMDSPAYSHHRILELLQRDFGLDGELQALVSERDQNLRLRVSDGRQYVVKIACATETAACADLQVSTLRHLESCGMPLELPRVLPTRDGDFLSQLDGNIMRVVTWVSGSILQRRDITPVIATSLGRAVALLGKALRGFDHEGKNRQMDWDMQRAQALREKTGNIADDDLRGDIGKVFDEFERRALPAFADLRRQVIHNDVNPDNVLIDPAQQAVTGIIDFGDLLEAPLIVDVAIAGSYLRHASDPFVLLAPFVQGYHEILPLHEQELELLQLLLKVRLATTVTMRQWRSVAFGDSDAYRQKSLLTEGDAEHFLRLLNEVGETGFVDQLLLTKK